MNHKNVRDEQPRIVIAKVLKNKAKYNEINHLFKKKLNFFQRLKCLGLWRSMVKKQWNSIQKQISFMVRTMELSSLLQKVQI